MKRIIIFLVILVALLCACGQEEMQMANKTIYASEDICVASGSPGRITFYSYVGYGGIDSGIMRTYIKFDLSDIPENAIITSAQLNMKYAASTGVTSPDLVFDIYRVIGSWDEDTMGWGTQPSVEGSPTITGLTCAYSTSYVAKAWDITALVAEMIANGADSIMLRGQNEGVINDKGFSVSENSQDYQPRLEIEYELPGEIYTSKGVLSKTAQEVYINVAKGNDFKLITEAYTASDKGLIDKQIF